MRARLELVAEHDALFSEISETWGSENKCLMLILKPIDLQLRVRSLGVDESDSQGAQEQWAGRSGNAERRMAQVKKELNETILASEKRMQWR